MFVIAGVKSGAGKTTVSLGLMAALKHRGLRVQPFKAGPDYIDPGLHASVCKLPSYNLDTWMMGAGGVSSTFARVIQGADIGIVEGVMGLFDGKSGAGAKGSTAHLARTLDLPVILVVDPSGMAGSVSALVKGFMEFDSKLRFMGVIFNRVASKRHQEIIAQAMRKVKGARVLGYIPRSDGLRLPERHLGLFSRGHIKDKKWSAFIKKARQTAMEFIDIDEIVRQSSKIKIPKASVKKKRIYKVSPVIAVARDEAFSFYYQENFDILEAFGARLAFFSPLRDEKLPEGAGGLYLGGGYPELFAEGLEGNTPMREEIKRFAASKAVLAECGGLVYLGKRLKLLNGECRSMCGVFPWTTTMTDKRVALGYRDVVMLSGALFLKAGARVRGHEYHYSKIGSLPSAIERAFSLHPDGPARGYIRRRTLATYIHLHFASNPALAKGFVERCRGAIAQCS